MSDTDYQIEMDPFTQQPRLATTTKEKEVIIERTGGGSRGDKGDPGEAGADGVPGQDGTVPDNEFTELATGLWTTDFATPYVELDLGTGGFAVVRYRRAGRMVEGIVCINIAADADLTGRVVGYIIPGTELPYMPKSPSYGGGGGAEVGGFGFITKPSSVEPPDPQNGYRQALIPAIINIGLGATMFFVIGSSEDNISGGAANLWGFSADTPIPDAELNGSIYVGRFFYEAADAE